MLSNFQEEVSIHLEVIERSLLQEDLNSELSQVLQELYSLKGVAAFAKVTNITTLVELLYKVFNGYQKKSLVFNKEHRDIITAVIEIIKNISKNTRDDTISIDKDVLALKEILNPVVEVQKNEKETVFIVSQDLEKIALSAKCFDKVVLFDDNSLIVDYTVKYFYHGSFFTVKTIKGSFDKETIYNYVLIFDDKALLVEDICSTESLKVDYYDNNSSSQPLICGRVDLNDSSLDCYNPKVL